MPTSGGQPDPSQGSYVPVDYGPTDTGGGGGDYDVTPASATTEAIESTALGVVRRLLPEGANFARPAVGRVMALLSAVPGPLKWAVRLLAMIASFDAGEWLLQKIVGAITGTWDGTTPEGTRSGAMANNVKNPTAAAWILNREFRDRAEREALIYIAAGFSSLNIHEFNSISPAARKYVRFFEVSTDQTIMSHVQVKIQTNGVFAALDQAARS
jgi:hypothetical protein